MPFIEYVPKKFSADHQQIIAQANVIVEQYRQQGYDLTLRQLYYQFVSRDLIPNNMQSYKRLGDIINQARLAGAVDWDAITDRTRNVRTRSHWGTPQSIIASAAYSYHKDMWAHQEWHVEIWIEKDALIGVIGGVCNELDLPHFSCRGYTSQSEVWAAARRMERSLREGKEIVVVHLGDHDPSGIDMTRDITDRLNLFVDGDGFDATNLTVHRIALNSDQIDQYNPPPNPAKLTDSRAEGYIARFGTESWELDALEPNVIVDLIRDTVAAYIDEDIWQEDEAEIAKERETLTAISARYDDIVTFLSQE